MAAAAVSASAAAACWVVVCRGGEGVGGCRARAGNQRRLAPACVRAPASRRAEPAFLHVASVGMCPREYDDDEPLIGNIMLALLCLARDSTIGFFFSKARGNCRFRISFRLWMFFKNRFPNFTYAVYNFL